MFWRNLITTLLELKRLSDIFFSFKRFTTMHTTADSFFTALHAMQTRSSDGVYKSSYLVSKKILELMCVH